VAVLVYESIIAQTHDSGKISIHVFYFLFPKVCFFIYYFFRYTKIPGSNKPRACYDCLYENQNCY